MKYLLKKFTVGLSNKKFRAGHDAIDWTNKAKFVYVPVPFSGEDKTVAFHVPTEKDFLEQRGAFKLK